MAKEPNTPSPNIVRRVCAAGSVEHAWVPALAEGGYVSVSAPHGVCLTFTQHFGCLVATNGKRLQRDVEAGCVSIAGPASIDWLVVREPADVVEVTAAPSVRRAIAEEMGVSEAAEMADQHGGTDSVVWAIAARVRTSLRSRAGAAKLELESLIWKLYRHLFEVRFRGRLPVKGDGRLAPRRLGRVLAYIDGHLADASLSIAALAQIASLSPFHFLRSFERTLNMTPHSFVRARRLERIRTALARAHDPAELARCYGFTHARYFRSAYRRHHGLWPGQELADALSRYEQPPSCSSTSAERA